MEDLEALGLERMEVDGWDFDNGVDRLDGFGFVGVEGIGFNG